MNRSFAALLALVSVPALAYSRTPGPSPIEIHHVQAAQTAQDQAAVTVDWKWAPWGARIRVDYGTTNAYGSSTDWIEYLYPSTPRLEGTDVFTLKNLKWGNTYVYRVHAEDIAKGMPKDAFLPVEATGSVVILNQDPRGLAITSVKVALPKPGQAQFWIARQTPADGAKMRVEYGPTSGYGHASAWQEKEGVIELDNLPGNTTYHFKVVAEHLDGSGAVQTQDETFVTGPSYSDPCKQSCLYADTRCSGACDEAAAKRKARLDACLSRCRADDPKCPSYCRDNSDYVSKAPVWAAYAMKSRCQSGWEVHHTFARIGSSCSPVDSDFCRDRFVWTATASLTCQRFRNGAWEYQGLNETLCSSARLKPVPVKAGWHDIVGGALECPPGRDPSTDCQVNCAQ